MDLRLRVGLNSGQVIAGEIGSGTLGYTAIGEQVGMAQRMESVAPPGGVMLSASTARLVDGAAALGEPEMVRIKGADEPVMARRLVAVGAQPAQTGLPGTALVGREWELNTVASMVDRSISGHGCVVDVTGPPGIGKSRLVYEATALARRRGAEVFSTFCESHAADVPFHVVARLLRDVAGIAHVDDETARHLVRAQVPGGSDEDLLLLNDLLGIGDPDAALPQIDPDARRRRITALINSLSLARTERLRRTAANCRATSAFAQQSPSRSEYPKSLRRAAQIGQPGQELRLTLETALLRNVFHMLIAEIRQPSARSAVLQAVMPRQPVKQRALSRDAHASTKYPIAVTNNLNVALGSGLDIVAPPDTTTLFPPRT